MRYTYNMDLLPKGKKSPTLDIATCTVHVDYVRNHLLIDRKGLDAKLTTETTIRLNSYGIKAVAGPTDTMLGGGWESAWSVIKNLWELRDLIGAITALLQVPLKLYQHYLNDAAKHQRPWVNVNLTIGGEGEIDPNYSYDDLNARLSVLSHAAYTETKRLEAEYPMYLFGSVVGVNLPSYGFSAKFITAANKKSSFNHERIMRVVNHLRFQEGLTLSVSINKAGLLVHAVTPQTLILDSPHSKNDWRIVNSESSGKQFYTFVSSRMVGGYMKLAPTMPYEHYHDRYLRSHV